MQQQFLTSSLFTCSTFTSF